MNTSQTTVPPLRFRTRANRQRWQEERVWLRKLSLRDRLMMNRDGSRREFLPARPIWGVVRNASALRRNDAECPMTDVLHRLGRARGPGDVLPRAVTWSW